MPDLSHKMSVSKEQIPVPQINVTPSRPQRKNGIFLGGDGDDVIDIFNFYDYIFSLPPNWKPYEKNRQRRRYRLHHCNWTCKHRIIGLKE